MEKVKFSLSGPMRVSLVGFITKEFPMKYGNYFGSEEHHVLNMWYENLKHLIDESGMFSEYPEKWGKGEWVAKTIDDAKQMAIDFARGVS